MPPSAYTQRGQLAARYGTPLQVARQLAPQYGVRGYQARAIASRPWGSGQESIIDWRASAPGKGVIEGRSVIRVRRTSEGGRTGFAPLDDTFFYSESAVAAPAGQLRRNLPLLAQIWSSRRIAAHTQREWVASAQRSYGAAAGAVSRSATQRMDSALDQSACVDEIINGTWPVQDSAGRRGEWSADGLGGNIDRYNRRHPNQPVRTVPLGQLRR